MSRETFVMRDGELVGKKDGKPFTTPKRREIEAPMITRDIPDYRSPIDGRWITSRTHRREDLIRNNCIEVDPPKKPRGFKNERFAKKRGLALNPELVKG